MHYCVFLWHGIIIKSLAYKYRDGMKHYVCQGECAGESKKPGVCKADDCTRNGEALIECNCTDGAHDEALFGGKDTDSLEETMDDDDPVADDE
jgi:hypothetical protein